MTPLVFEANCTRRRLLSSQETICVILHMDNIVDAFTLKEVAYKTMVRLPAYK